MSNTQSFENSDSQHPAVVIGMYGLMRNGNHAIASWLLDQYPGRVSCFLNNTDPETDPFDSCRGWQVRNAPEPDDAAALRAVHAHCLIYSYEDRETRHRADRQNFLERAQAGFSVTACRFREIGVERHFQVGVIRDPFNSFASRLILLRQRGPCGGEADMNVVAEDWKHMARHALEVGSGMKGNEIVIRYNHWLRDSRYRATISESLGGDARLALPTAVPSFGGGSSFQAIRPLTWGEVLANPSKVLSPQRWRRASHYLKRLAARRAKPADLTERWRQLEHDGEFCRLFADPEIWRLAGELFGRMPGTSALKSHAA